jgi:hypothetical protein
VEIYIQEKLKTLNPNAKTGPSIFDSSRPASASSAAKGIRIDYEQINEEQVTIAEQQNMVNRWWDEIDEKKIGFSRLRKVAEKLVEMKFANESPKGKRIV